MWTAFGESKSLKEWAKDPRCKVCFSTLLSRVTKYRWPIERAITEPKRKSGGRPAWWRESARKIGGRDATKKMGTV